MKYIITIEQINSILQYLGSKPYADVFQLVELLRSLPTVPDQESEPKSDEPTA